MNCSNCGKKLEHLEVEDTVASVVLQLKDGVYIPVLTLFDYENFRCPECGQYLADDQVPISKNLICVSVSGMHKPVLIDLQDIPFDTKNVEWMEKLPGKLRIKRKKKE